MHNEAKTQVSEKLLEAYLLTVDCILKRLEYLNENVTEGMNPLMASPFVESLPGKLESLIRIAERLGLLDDSE